MPKKPEQTLVSMLVSNAIDRLASQKTQKELARDIGFIKPGMLSMVRSGAARIPFTRLPVFAAVLGIDPALLIRTHLKETWPAFEEVVDEVFGGITTQAERDWIEFFESVGMIAPPCDEKKRQKLIDILMAEDWEEKDEN